MDWNQVLWVPGKFPAIQVVSVIFLFYPILNPSQFKLMMLAFLAIRTLTFYRVMPQCFHRVTSRYSSYYSWGSLNRLQGLWLAFICQQMLEYSSIWNIFKRIRINLRLPDGRWHATCGLSTDQSKLSLGATEQLICQGRWKGGCWGGANVSYCHLLLVRVEGQSGAWRFWAFDHFKKLREEQEACRMQKAVQILQMFSGKKHNYLDNSWFRWQLKWLWKSLRWKGVLAEAVMPNSDAYIFLHVKLNGLLRYHGCIGGKK